jgi:putative ABC transport system permease protein
MSEGKPTRPGVRRSMFWRLWLHSFTVKRSQAGLAISSLLVGAAVASMLLNLYGDVRRKMTQEFRAYGPNVVVAPQEPAAAASPRSAAASAPGGLMEESNSPRAASALASLPRAVAVPVLYSVVELQRIPPDPRLPEFQNLVAAGVDFASLRSLYPGWRMQGGQGAGDSGGAVIGSRVAALLHLGPGDSFQLSALAGGGKSAETPAENFPVAGVVTTGASEDDQVFVPLARLQKLTGLESKISLIELSIPGDAAEIERASRGIAAALPGIDVRPIRQIVYSSGRVLGTIRWLTVSLTALILIIIALSVTATMTTIVMERKKDVAVMKSLGASDGLVMRLFLSEGAGLGLIGGLVGFILGVLLARGLAERLFSVGLSPTWWTLPAVALAAVLLAVVATLIPVKIVHRVQPATVLKGE